MNSPSPFRQLQAIQDEQREGWVPDHQQQLAEKDDGAERVNNGWKLITEAPRNGTRIFSYRAGWAESMAVVFWSESLGNWIPVCGNVWAEPTHFQPLPEPPTL